MSQPIEFFNGLLSLVATIQIRDDREAREDIDELPYVAIVTPTSERVPLEQLAQAVPGRRSALPWANIEPARWAWCVPASHISLDRRNHSPFQRVTCRLCWPVAGRKRSIDIPLGRQLISFFFPPINLGTYGRREASIGANASCLAAQFASKPGHP